MCNPRPISDSDDESSESTKQLLDVSKLTLKAIRPKSGRKGDPRMHRALEARLNNPNTSLLDALNKGGFEFHMVDNVWYDKDDILLSQRKNQLSRRVRLFKQSQQKLAEARLKAKKEKSTSSEVPPVNENKEDTDETMNEEQQQQQPEAKNKRTLRRNEMSVALKKQKLKAPEPEACSDSCAKSILSSSSFPSMTSSSYKDVTALSDVSYSEDNNSKPASQDLNTAPQIMANFQAQVDEKLNAQANNDRCAPISRVNANCNNNIDAKLHAALNVYLHMSSRLMSTCLQAAGFSEDESKENGGAHSKLAEKILICEQDRFRKMKMTSMDETKSSSSLPPFQDEVAIMSVSTSGTSSPDLFAPIDAFVMDTVTPKNNDFSTNSLPRGVPGPLSHPALFHQNVANTSSFKQQAVVPIQVQSCPPHPYSNNSYGINPAVNNNSFAPFSQWNAGQPYNSSNHPAAIPQNNQTLTHLGQANSHMGANILNDGRMMTVSSSYSVQGQGENQIKEQDVMKLVSALEPTDHPMSDDSPKIYDLTDSNIIGDDELVDILRKSSKDDLV